MSHGATDTSSSRAACPRCGERVEWVRLFLGRPSNPFTCRKCGQLLKINPERISAMLGLFAIVALAIGLWDVDVSVQIIWVVVCCCIVVLLYGQFAKVETL